MFVTDKLVFLQLRKTGCGQIARLLSEYEGGQQIGVHNRITDDLKSKFVSIASHEFRTPLSTVMSSASLIEQYNQRGENDKVTKHVQRIKSSVNNLTSILNDFLSLGRLEEGKIEVVRESLAVSDFMQEVEEELTPTLKAGQYITVHCEAGTEQIFSDPRILRNILFNLISNASKYSGEGKPVYITCRMEGNKMCFIVRDEGIGIPADDQRHMFDRFFRASNAGNFEGTGLGLSIVQCALAAIGGRVVGGYGVGGAVRQAHAGAAAPPARRPRCGPPRQLPDEAGFGRRLGKAVGGHRR